MTRWHDKPHEAVSEIKQDLEAEGFIVCEMSDGFIAEPPEGSRKSRRHLNVVYSEARDQYRCSTSIVHIGSE